MTRPIHWTVWNFKTSKFDKGKNKISELINFKHLQNPHQGLCILYTAVQEVLNTFLCYSFRNYTSQSLSERSVANMMLSVVALCLREGPKGQLRQPLIHISYLGGKNLQHIIKDSMLHKKITGHFSMNTG